MPVTPLLFVRENVVDTGIVTAGSELATLPASNVQTEAIGQIFKAATTLSTYLLVNLRQQLELGGTALMNCVTDNAVRIRLSTADATGEAGNSYDETVISSAEPIYRKMVHSISPAATGDGCGLMA